MNDERIILQTVVNESRDGSGFVNRETIEGTEIFAGVKSVARMEFYEALRNGIKASIIFTVNPDDYLLGQREIVINETVKKVNASRILYEGNLYRIVRSYKVDANCIELTCEEVE